MLKRLYVDNYKALVNFELKLDGHALLMGANGSGKSTVLDVINALAHFAEGASVDETFGLFDIEFRTRWESRNEQVFEIEVTGDRAYAYRLVLLGHAFFFEVLEERLSDGPHVLLSRTSDKKATISNDSGGTEEVLVPDAFHSILPALARGWKSAGVIDFTQSLASIGVLRPDPRQMSGRSEKETSRLAPNLSNFASWWRHAWQEQPEALQAALVEIGQTLPGFRSMSVQRTEKDEFRVLRTRWDVGEPSAKPVDFTFDELSDGQRIIIALHTAARWLGVSGGTLIIDEPDNYVALAEIQPLIRGLLDTDKVQLIVASHHPEILNEMAVEYGVRLWRDRNGPVRVEKFAPPADSMLTPAELVAGRLDTTDG